MVIQCESCQAKFRLDDSKIGPKGAKVKCTKCATVFRVMPGGAPPPPEPIDGGLGISFDEGDSAAPPMPPVEAPAPPPPVKATPPVVETPAPPVAPPVEATPPGVETPAPPLFQTEELPPVEETPTPPPMDDPAGYFSGEDGNLSIGGDLADSDDFSGESPGVGGGADFSIPSTEESQLPAPPTEGVPENTEGEGGYYDANTDFVDSSESTDYAIDFGSAEEEDNSGGLSFGFDSASEETSDDSDNQNETVVFSIGGEGSDLANPSSESEEEKTVFGFTPEDSGEAETMQADGGSVSSEASSVGLDDDEDGDIVFTGPPVKEKKEKAPEEETPAGVSGADIGSGMGEDFEQEEVDDSAFTLPDTVYEEKKASKKLSMPSFDFSRFKKPVMTLLILGIVGGGGYYLYPIAEPYITEATKDIDVPSLEELGMPDLHTDEMMESLDEMVGGLIKALPEEVVGLLGKSSTQTSSTVVEIQNVSGAFKKNVKLGSVFVLRGTIKNKSSEELNLKGARGILYNSEGEVIASNSTEPGRDLTADAIKNNSEAEFIKSLSKNRGAKVPAGSSMPITVIFTELPKGMTEANIEVTF